MLSPATSAAVSSHNIPWYSPASWVMAWTSWWERPTQAIERESPHREEFVKFKEKCDRLIAQANTRTADPWYCFSLEDLREDVEEMVKNPEAISENTLKDFSRRLDGIKNDFLRKPLSEKPSFFASIHFIKTPWVDSNNAIQLWVVSTPLLETGPAPLALGD